MVIGLRDVGVKAGETSGAGNLGGVLGGGVGKEFHVTRKFSRSWEREAGRIELVWDYKEGKGDAR